MGAPPSASSAEAKALGAACGLVASADGWVTIHEREALRARLRLSSASQRFDLEVVLDTFEEVIDKFEADPDAAEAHARKLVRRARGGDGLSIVEAAAAVADSDGGYDGAERDVLIDLCRTLGVEAGRLGLVPSQRA